MKKAAVSVYSAVRKLLDEDLLGRSAQTAFYLLLAFFPLGLFAVSILSRLQEETLLKLPITAPGGLLPAELFEMLSSTPALGAGTVWLLLGSVWAASAGVWALMKAVHAAHMGHRLRSLPARLSAIGFMLGFVVVLALSFALTFFGAWLALAASWLAVYVLLFALYSLFFLPKASRPRPRRAARAAFGAATLWMLATWGFEVYMRYFSRYTELYGSIGAFLGLALWLYVISIVVILGAETLKMGR